MRLNTAVLAALLCLATQAAGAFEFDPYQNYDIGGNAKAVVVGDVDGDGLDDVVLTAYLAGETSVFVFFQHADGSLDSPIILDYHWPFVESSLALADFNHDGIEDFVVGSYEGITLFMGNSSRELSGTQINGPVALLLGTTDVDRDGHVDVVAPSSGQEAYTTIYYGDGNGGIREQTQLPAPLDPVLGFKVGDVNSDGFDDLALASHHLYIYLHDQVSGFSSTPLIIQRSGSAYIGGTAIGDFNDDGINDIAIGDRESVPSKISIYPQVRTRTKRAEPVNLATTYFPTTMLSDDLDGDGRDDLLVSHDGWYRVGLYTQGDAGLLPEITTGTYTSANPTGMALGDVNGDGCKDLAIAVTGESAGLVMLHGNDCEVRPDLRVSVGLASTSVTIRLDHIWGETPIQEPLVQLDLTVLSGTLQTGTLPDDCVVQAQTESTRRIECLAATLEAGTRTTLIIPISVTGGGQSNPLHAAVEASTDTPERSLANNQATKSILLNPDMRVPVPSTRLRSVIGQWGGPSVSGLPAQPH